MNCKILGDQESEIEKWKKREQTREKEWNHNDIKVIESEKSHSNFFWNLANSVKIPLVVKWQDIS